MEYQAIRSPGMTTRRWMIALAVVEAACCAYRLREGQRICRTESLSKGNRCTRDWRQSLLAGRDLRSSRGRNGGIHEMASGSMPPVDCHGEVKVSPGDFCRRESPWAHDTHPSVTAGSSLACCSP